MRCLGQEQRHSIPLPLFGYFFFFKKRPHFEKEKAKINLYYNETHLNENLYGNNDTFHPIPISWQKKRESRSGFFSVLALSFDSALEACTATPDGGLLMKAVMKLMYQRDVQKLPTW